MSRTGGTLRSLYEIKAVPQATEGNEARPILPDASPGGPRSLSVLGSKLDNVHDVEALLAAKAWD